MIKVGSPVLWGSDIIPNLTMVLDGSELDISLYPRLYMVFKRNYTPVDTDRTKFLIPDFRGRTIRGVDEGSGNDPEARDTFNRGVIDRVGRADRGDGVREDSVGTTQIDAWKEHRHLGNMGAGSSNSNTAVAGGSGIGGSAAALVSQHRIGNSVPNASETRCDNIALTFITFYQHDENEDELPITNTTITVRESGLPGGTTEGDDSHIYEEQLSLLGGSSKFLITNSQRTQYGEFSVTEDGYLRYELTTNVTTEPHQDGFVVMMLDNMGNPLELYSILVNIVDDQPIAGNHSYTVVDGGPMLEESLMDKITLGGDGATITSVTFGTTTVNMPSSGVLTATTDKGTLTLSDIGELTYTINSESEVVLELLPNEQIADIFSYELTDGDGDVDTGHITIRIKGKDDIVELNIVNNHTTNEPNGNDSDQVVFTNYQDSGVEEDGLVNSHITFRAVDGLDPTEAITLTSGTTTTTLTKSNIQGLNTIPIEINTTYGKLTLNSYTMSNGLWITVGYKYELLSWDGIVEEDMDNITIKVKDRDGDYEEDDISVKIVHI